MNYKQLVNIVNSASIKHANVQEFAEGDIYEILNNSEHKYPTVVLTVQNISAGEGDTLTLNGTLFYVDRLLLDSSNKLEVQALAIQVLKQIQDKIEDELGASNIFLEIYTPFTEKFADVCAGAFVQLQVSYIQELDCDDNFETRKLSIAEDGIYGVTGYDTVIVDVTKVRTIDGHSGNITLGEGLTIDDDNILSALARQDYDESVAAFKSMEKLNDYLYSIEYNSIDYEAAKEHYSTQLNERVGGCSLIRKGNQVGRSYDWYINKQVEFVVKTPAKISLHSVTGIATCTGITTDNVNTYSDEYKYLPFRLVDGINDKGLVCAVNELPINQDLSKNISPEGSAPTVEEREEVSMIMLVRYILDHFETAISAGEYIKKYIRVKPIIDVDGNPMNFHFCIADKNQTIYLYFYGNNCNYEVKQSSKNLIMTNFRLEGTQLVEGHYSVTDSNIEDFGQGIERANALIDYNEGDLLEYLKNTIGFTKAYTTTDRLTDFAGIDDATIVDTDTLVAIQADAAALYGQEVADGTLREDADLWQTVHSVVYDFNDKSIKLNIQEIENNSEIFTFIPYDIYEEKIEALEDGKLDKSTTVSTIYGVDKSSEQVNFSIAGNLEIQGNNLMGRHFTAFGLNEVTAVKAIFNSGSGHSNPIVVYIHPNAGLERSANMLGSLIVPASRLLPSEMSSNTWYNKISKSGWLFYDNSKGKWYVLKTIPNNIMTGTGLQLANWAKNDANRSELGTPQLPDFKTVAGQSIIGTGDISAITSVKTINNQTIVGTGNIDIQGGDGYKPRKVVAGNAICASSLSSSAEGHLDVYQKAGYSYYFSNIAGEQSFITFKRIPPEDYSYIRNHSIFDSLDCWHTGGDPLRSGFSIRIRANEFTGHFLNEPVDGIFFNITENNMIDVKQLLTDRAYGDSLYINGTIQFVQGYSCKTTSPNIEIINGKITAVGRLNGRVVPADLTKRVMFSNGGNVVIFKETREFRGKHIKRVTVQVLNPYRPGNGKCKASNVLNGTTFNINDSDDLASIQSVRHNRKLSIHKVCKHRISIYPYRMSCMYVYNLGKLLVYPIK